MATKNTAYPDIVIGDGKYKHVTFKIHELEDDEVPRLLEAIFNIGDFARKHPNSQDIKSIVSNSPLHHIQGLVRHQLNRLLGDKYVSNSDLKSPSDFIHEETLIRDFYCIKTTFLFNFLRDIVKLCYAPEFIDQQAIDKFECNLRGLFFLAESQITGSKKGKGHIFEGFLYFLWEKNNSKHMTIDGFWKYVIGFIHNENNCGELEFQHKGNTYIARGVEGKRKVGKIKIVCESNGELSARPKGKRWFKDNWPKLQRSFENNLN